MTIDTRQDAAKTMKNMPVDNPLSPIGSITTALRLEGKVGPELPPPAAGSTIPLEKELGDKVKESTLDKERTNPSEK
jgi:hypothetical protein